jgi:hypothetical protein
LSHPREPEDRTDEALPWRPHVVMVIYSTIAYLSPHAQWFGNTKESRIENEIQNIETRDGISDEVKERLNYLNIILSGDDAVGYHRSQYTVIRQMNLSIDHNIVTTVSSNLECI